MRLRALVPCALLVFAASAHAADHAVTWGFTCCASGPVHVDAVAGDTVTFTMDAGTFASHPLVWDFGDYATTDSGTSQPIPLTGKSPGTYAFHCQFHSFMTGTVTIPGDQHATAALDVSPASVTTADPVTLTYTGTADPDVGDSIASYEWDFNGDGTTDATTTVDHVTHTFASAGTYPATVRVRDQGHELSDPAPAKSVAVTAAPTPQGGTGSTGTGGSTGSTGSGGATSPDGSGASGSAGSIGATADTTAPAATHVRVARGRLRFALSEDANLRASLRRNGKSVRQLGVALKAGAVAYRLPRHLKKGRYTIRFSLVDAAGNRSKTYSASFRVT
jgi:plastocyanin